MHHHNNMTQHNKQPRDVPAPQTKSEEKGREDLAATVVAASAPAARKLPADLLGLGGVGGWDLGIDQFLVGVGLTAAQHADAGMYEGSVAHTGWAVSRRRPSE